MHNLLKNCWAFAQNILGYEQPKIISFYKKIFEE